MTVGIPSDEKFTENQSIDDSSHLVQENVYEAVLKKTYKMYKLLCGSFYSTLESSINEENLSHLKDKLNSFYSKVR